MMQCDVMTLLNLIEGMLCNRQQTFQYNAVSSGSWREICVYYYHGTSPAVNTCQHPSHHILSVTQAVQQSIVTVDIHSIAVTL
jgi:hypothetical protein